MTEKPTITELTRRMEILQQIEITQEGLKCKKCQSLSCQHVVDFKALNETIKGEKRNEPDKLNWTDS